MVIDEETITVVNLQPETCYIFKILTEFSNGKCVISELSDPIMTSTLSLAHKVLKQCTHIQKTQSPKIYQLPTRDSCFSEGIVKSHIGVPKFGVAEKVLLVVGATGEGKSTLINGMVNYIMGVKWEDEFRLKLIDNEDSHSYATDRSCLPCLTAYTIHHMEGSPVPFTVTIVDSPEFCDIESRNSNQDIVKLIKDLFSFLGEKGIDQLHGIGFIANDWSSTHQYMYTALCSIFGKNIGSKTYLFTTFTNAKKPSVLDAADAANISRKGYFKFNNSALYVEKSKAEEVDGCYWTADERSFKSFMEWFLNSSPQSLQLNAASLETCECLQTAIRGVQSRIYFYLSKVVSLMHEIQLLSNDEVKLLKEFTYVVETTKQRQVELRNGRYAISCRYCNITCLEGIGSPDADLYNCAAVGLNQDATTAGCSVCPNNCLWKMHHTFPYKYELYQDMETKTSLELQNRYGLVNNIFEELSKDLEKVKEAILIKIMQVKKIFDRLNEISPSQKRLSAIEYVDFLIQSEELKANQSSSKRVEALQIFRKQASNNL